MAGLFPRYVEQEDVEDLLKLVSIGELENTLKWFKKEKSPSLDNWSIELYISFFDLLGEDLLHSIE